MKDGNSVLEAIITSRTRRKILALFYQHLDIPYYLRAVVRETNEEVNAVKRELDILVVGKVLKKEHRLNKVFFTLNKNYLFYDEFVRMFAKINPFASQIMAKFPMLGKVKFAVMSVAFIKKTTIKPGEIYLLFVGVLVIPEITQLINQEEINFGNEIHYSVMPEDEFNFRKKKSDPFLWNFLKQPKIMLHGTEEDLMKSVV